MWSRASAVLPLVGIQSQIFSANDYTPDIHQAKHRQDQNQIKGANQGRICLRLLAIGEFDAPQYEISPFDLGPPFYFLKHFLWPFVFSKGHANLNPQKSSPTFSYSASPSWSKTIKELPSAKGLGLLISVIKLIFLRVGFRHDFDKRLYSIYIGKELVRFT